MADGGGARYLRICGPVNGCACAPYPIVVFESVTVYDMPAQQNAQQHAGSAKRNNLEHYLSICNYRSLIKAARAYESAMLAHHTFW